jgi:hypothetical protein
VVIEIRPLLRKLEGVALRKNSRSVHGWYERLDSSERRTVTKGRDKGKVQNVVGSSAL